MFERQILVSTIIFILLASLFQPALAYSISNDNPDQDPFPVSVETISVLRGLSQFQVQDKTDETQNIQALIEASTDMTDTDGDGLPDSVEIVIGTDPGRKDSDIDGLDDLNETIVYGSDPLKPDSDGDGLGDSQEVTNVLLDVDKDGFPNVWDLDSDGDGAMDGADNSPFSKSAVNNSFHFNIATNGNPLYIDFQLKPENPDHLNLPSQFWDWPPDHEGTMMDLNDSKNDIQILPMLELTLNSLPNISEVKDYDISIEEPDNKRIALISLARMYISTNGTDVKVNQICQNCYKNPTIGENETFELKELDNNNVALKARNDMYLSINATGKFFANRSSVGANESFKFIDLGNNTFALRSNNGLYANATKGGLFANSNSIGINETFRIIKIKSVALKAGNGKYVSARGGGAGGLYAESVKPGLWETFELIDYGNMEVVLKAVNGLFVYGNGQLIANSPAISSNEVFEISDRGNNSVAFRGNNKLNVTVEADRLISKSTTIGSNETFELQIQDKTKIKAYVPLTQIKDYGNINSLKGRMFYPASEPLNLSVDAELVWMAIGKNDAIGEKVAFDSSKGHISQEEGGSWISSQLIPRAGAVGTDETFEIIRLGGNKVALKASNGKYVTFDSFYSIFDGLIYYLHAQSDKIGNKETFLTESIGDKIRLKASNNLYVSIVNNKWPRKTMLSLTGNPDGSELFEMETIKEAEYGSTVLATYRENFMLTGLSVDENYGSDAGVFYSSDINQTINAGLVMAYQFLRNQTTLSEMPAFLAENNVTIFSNNDSFSHEDGAIMALMSRMTPDALKALPLDSTIPVINALEEQFVSMQMDELVSGSYILGNNLQINITQKPIITAKTMKMGWYNTTTKEVAKPEIVLDEIDKWGNENGLDEDEKIMLTGVMMTWNIGEATITRIGPDKLDFGAAGEALKVFKFIKNYVMNSLKVILMSIKIPIYVMSNTQFANLLKLHPVLSKAPAVFLDKEFNLIKTNIGGTLGKFADKFGKVLSKIGYVIAIAIGFLYFFSIAIGEDWSTVGVVAGIFIGVIAIIYGVLLVALGSAFPVGTIIAAIISIVDLILSIFGIGFMDWVIKAFYSVDERSKVDLVFESTSPSIHDYDKNGLDAGDRIELRSRILEKVWITGDGNSNDLRESFITPYYSQPFYFYFFAAPKIVSYSYEISRSYDNNNAPTTKLVKHDVGFWAEPDNSRINFPLTFNLAYNYKIYMDKCTFFGLICWRSSKEDWGYSDPSTLYFDVLPGNISDFAGWNSIFSQDLDGDGLSNSEESTNQTNRYLTDTDSDGLSDKFELDHGTSPAIRDTDGDGLNDGLELRIGTDPNKKDTDDDYLNDFEENRGWKVTFYYGSSPTPFYFKVTSDPLKPDTDGDGLTDFEEFFRKLNPESKDTNGDGTSDSDSLGSLNQGMVRFIDLNHKGNSIKINPGENIAAYANYRIKARINETTNESVLSQINITMDNSLFTIYNGTPDIDNPVENSTTFSFNAPDVEGVYPISYYLRYYFNETSIEEIPGQEERDIIGVIDTTNVTCGSYGWVPTGNDTDGDGLIDQNEKIGWAINFTNPAGLEIGHVTSDPSFADTDSDGLTDWQEYELCSNPRDIDTDGDRLSDSEEIALQTNITYYDTDSDGLDDGTEIDLGSDPKDMDSDDDGLSDYEEFNLGTSPIKVDTDADGLNDKFETMSWEITFTNMTGRYTVNVSSDATIADTDGDGLNDGLEYTNVNKSNPADPDTDGDGLNDDEEIRIGTRPDNYDTDDDQISDGEEIILGTDPTKSDTDGDNLSDSKEIELGTDPLLIDTNLDGINDYEDPDSYSEHVDNVVLASEPDPSTYDLINKLSNYTNVTVVSADEFMANHTDDRYIVLVGRPDAGNGTVGNITYNILIDSQDILASMLSSDTNRLFTGYGIWNSPQTVVMLSHPYSSDHFKILNILKSYTKQVKNGSVIIEYPTMRKLFRADGIKEMDAFVQVYLEESVQPTVILRNFNSSNVQFSLTPANEKDVGKYLDINVSENIQNSTSEIVDHALIAMLYTASDLDRTGDMDANDPGDINENTLAMNWFNTSAGKWEKLDAEMDWVNELGVDTNNTFILGRDYEGYVWANVSHLSLYGLSGRVLEQPRNYDTSAEGFPIFPMFTAIPEWSYYRPVVLGANVSQRIQISNISGIYELVLRHTETTSLMLYLSKVKSLPTSVPGPQEKVYSYFELLFTKYGTTERVNPVAQINYKVPRGWADDKDRIKLMKYDNGWQQVHTWITAEDEEYFYFRADVNSFSLFAIALTEVTAPEEAISSTCHN